MTLSLEVTWPKDKEQGDILQDCYNDQLMPVQSQLTSSQTQARIHSWDTGHPVLGQNAELQSELSTHKLRVDTFDKAHQTVQHGCVFI